MSVCVCICVSVSVSVSEFVSVFCVYVCVCLVSGNKFLSLSLNAMLDLSEISLSEPSSVQD